MQKRDKNGLIWFLCAMGRRQKDSKVVSTCIIKHKAVGSWDGMGQREVGAVQQAKGKAGSGPSFPSKDQRNQHVSYG